MAVLGQLRGTAGALLVAALVVGTAPPTVAQQDRPGAAREVAGTGERASGKVRTVAREVGGRPFRIRPREPVDLVLRGRRGDRIHLAVLVGSDLGLWRTRLVGPGGRELTLDPAGYGRLPVGGRWRARLHGGYSGERLQVTRVRKLDLGDRSVLRAPGRRGTEYAVSFAKPTSGAVRVRLRGGATTVEHGGKYSDGAYAALVLSVVVTDAGAVLGTEYGEVFFEAGQSGATTLHSLPGRALRARRTAIPVRPAVLDGPAYEVGSTPALFELDGDNVLNGSAGGLFTIEPGADVGRREVLVLDPDGSRSEEMHGGGRTGRSIFRAVPGAMRVLIEPGRSRVVRFGSVVAAGALTIGAEATRVALRPDTRPLLYDVSPVGTRYGLVVESASITTPWLVTAGSLTPWDCPPGSPLSCGDVTTYVDLSAPGTDPGSSPTFEEGISGGKVLVNAPGASAGEIVVRLAPTVGGRGDWGRTPPRW